MAAKLSYRQKLCGLDRSYVLYQLNYVKETIHELHNFLLTKRLFVSTMPGTIDNQQAKRKKNKRSRQSKNKGMCLSLCDQRSKASDETTNRENLIKVQCSQFASSINESNSVFKANFQNFLDLVNIA